MVNSHKNKQRLLKNSTGKGNELDTGKDRSQERRMSQKFRKYCQRCWYEPNRAFQSAAREA